MNKLEKQFQAIGGVRPIWREKFMPFSEKEVAQLEKKWKFSLPKYYREFLQLYGEISFEESICFTPVEKLPKEVSSDGKGTITKLYGKWTEEYDGYSLESNLDTYQERMPKSLMAIGDDRLRSLTCLGIRGEEYGKVYFWDVENEQDEEDFINYGEPVPPDLMFRNVYLIANSFEEFLDCLETYEID